MAKMATNGPTKGTLNARNTMPARVATTRKTIMRRRDGVVSGIGVVPSRGCGLAERPGDPPQWPGGRIQSRANARVPQDVPGVGPLAAGVEAHHLGLHQTVYVEMPRHVLKRLLPEKVVHAMAA